MLIVSTGRNINLSATPTLNSPLDIFSRVNWAIALEVNSWRV